MTLLNKEPVKRAEKCLKEFDENLSVVELEKLFSAIAKNASKIYTILILQI